MSPTTTTSSKWTYNRISLFLDREKKFLPDELKSSIYLRYAYTLLEVLEESPEEIKQALLNAFGIIIQERQITGQYVRPLSEEAKWHLIKSL